MIRLIRSSVLGLRLFIHIKALFCSVQLYYLKMGMDLEALRMISVELNKADLAAVSYNCLDALAILRVVCPCDLRV